MTQGPGENFVDLTDSTLRISISTRPSPPPAAPDTGLHGGPGVATVSPHLAAHIGRASQESPGHVVAFTGSTLRISIFTRYSPPHAAEFL
jgi:hypothetical protein